MTTATAQRITQADLIGQPVLTMAHEGTMRYDGPDSGGFESMIFGMGGTGILTTFDRIAPADIPIADSDPRITVTKGTTAEARRAGHYGRGAWRLSLPERWDTWHDTKRDAVTAGLRRLAILDWHAANAA